MVFRILIWSLVFFFGARFLWRLLSPFLNSSQPDKQPGKVPEAPQPPKEEFKDVRDAKFIDVPKSSADREKENGES